MLNIRPLDSAFKKGPLRGRGFEITIQQLQEKIKLLLNDDGFKFGYVGENETVLDDEDYAVTSITKPICYC